MSPIIAKKNIIWLHRDYVHCIHHPKKNEKQGESWKLTEDLNPRLVLESLLLPNDQGFWLQILVIWMGFWIFCACNWYSLTNSVFFIFKNGTSRSSVRARKIPSILFLFICYYSLKKALFCAVANKQCPRAFCSE